VETVNDEKFRTGKQPAPASRLPRGVKDETIPLGQSSGIMVCPRCGSPMYAPFIALSRVYQKTHICCDCGRDEASLQLSGQDAQWTIVSIMWEVERNRYESELHETEKDLESLAEQFEEQRTELAKARRKLPELHKRLDKNAATFKALEAEIDHLQTQLKMVVTQLLDKDNP
jgi:uncharacterized coiled-coil protein SlyX